MNRIFSLALAAFFVLGTFASAQAVEIEVKGEFTFAWMYVDNGNFYDHGWDAQSEDQFHARQRTRIQVDFVASENLQGIFIAEIGEMQWGQPGTGRSRGAALGADAVNIETKRMLIQFNVPDTELLFSVGVQGLATPGVIAGSPIFDDDVAGVLAQYPINDMVTIGVFWARLFDLQGNNITSPSSPLVDEFDMFGLLAPIKGDGWKVHPYFIFAAVGNDVFQAGNGQPGMLSPAHNALLTYAPASPFYLNIINDQPYIYGWWAGTTFELDMYDPFTFRLEGVYGSVEADVSAADRHGFYIAAELDYALDFMTIGLMGWYASGEDGSWTNGSEQLPMVSESWNPTSFGWDGGSLLSAGGVLSATAGNNNNPAGKWGLMLSLKDLTFIEDLTHQFRVLFAMGTNAPESRRIVGAVFPNLILGYKNTYNAAFVVPAGSFTLPGPTIVPGIELTTEDYMFEVNFDHEYKVYENLALILELGMVHVQYGNDLFVHADTSTGWKAAWGLKYKF